MFLIVILFILITCIYVWRRNALVRCRYKNLPPLYPGALPILGHCLLLVSYGDVTSLWSLIKKASNLTTKSGGIMTMYIGESIYFVVTDPNDSAMIANVSADKDAIYNMGKVWLGNGLITASGETWKRHRKCLNPAFSQKMINAFIDIFNANSRLLTDNLEDKMGKTPFDPTDYLSNITLETIYQTAFGINPKNHVLKNKNAYLEAVHRISDTLAARFEKFWLHSEFIHKWSSLKKQQDIFLQVIKETLNEIINYKKEADQSLTDMEYKLFMDLLLEYSAEGQFSREEVKDEINTMLVAGYETTATLLVHIFLLLGSYPDVQNKIYEELKEVFGNSLRDVDKDDIPKLIYLEAVIKECLRVCPIIPAVTRHISQDIKLNKYTLPAGSNCIFLIYGIHRHPIWGADVDQFRPERWLESPAPPCNAFVGFGLGKRSCIGKKYGMTFMVTNLAHVLRRYRITSDISKVTYKAIPMLWAHTGCLISIDKRTT